MGEELSPGYEKIQNKQLYFPAETLIYAQMCYWNKNRSTNGSMYVLFYISNIFTTLTVYHVTIHQNHREYLLVLGSFSRPYLYTHQHQLAGSQTLVFHCLKYSE